ncbi:hypothetical protein L1987_54504 [Smallanthus sonchifolius]|uniref:Uncharacterized protein n=1 Tax=Smallanthus sonchifolius TaxID=185202 RepID=A0ACB9E7S0_9ASTR|nr:hypothetical protein L1987_54504 [Smallanthus sonchifolius]
MRRRWEMKEKEPIRNPKMAGYQDVVVRPWSLGEGDDSKCSHGITVEIQEDIKAFQDCGSGSPKNNGRVCDNGVGGQSFESTGEKIRPILKPAILRPKKVNCANLNASPMEDKRPTKKQRADIPFDLNRLLGLSPFGVTQVDIGLEEGEIRDPGKESSGAVTPKSIDLNLMALPVVLDNLCNSSSCDDEVVMDSLNHQEINEAEATMKMGDIVGACLGNHSDMINEIIYGEGNSVVNQ